MQADLQDLKITQAEIEKLSGLDVSDVFIGSLWGGTYRPSIFRSPQKIFSFCLTEFSVLILIFILTLPIGLLATRDTTQSVNDSQSIIHFLRLTLGVTLVLVAGWNLHMWGKGKSFGPLAKLLDEVDKYNDVIQAVDILDKLKATGSQINLINGEEVLQALRITRESLVCALITEKILREHHALIARRHELFINIETNLTTLRTLEIQNQATEYGHLLNEALRIGMSVYKEIQDLQAKN